MPDYEPVNPRVRMSKYGYWIVTYSVEPGMDISVMICKTGITPGEAATMALTVVSATPGKGKTG